MAKHDVTIASRGLDMKGKAGDKADANGVTGAEHKVKLSDATLRAVGLHGGRQKGLKEPVDLRDQEGAIHLPAPKKGDCQTVADVVSYLSAKHKGYFERTPALDSEGQDIVTVKFTYGDGADIVTGSGKTTKAAVKAMVAKLPGNETFDCLEG